MSLQLEELVAGVDDDRDLVVRDYLREPGGKRSRTVAQSLAELDALDAHRPARPLARRAGHRLRRRARRSTQPVSPRGYRLLARVPRLPDVVVERLVGTSAACRSCSPPASTTCRASRASARPGPGRCARACLRLAESSILERYV